MRERGREKTLCGIYISFSPSIRIWPLFGVPFTAVYKIIDYQKHYCLRLFVQALPGNFGILLYYFSFFISLIFFFANSFSFAPSWPSELSIRRIAECVGTRREFLARKSPTLSTYKHKLFALFLYFRFASRALFPRCSYTLWFAIAMGAHLVAPYSKKNHVCSISSATFSFAPTFPKRIPLREHLFARFCLLALFLPIN